MIPEVGCQFTHYSYSEGSGYEIFLGYKKRKRCEDYGGSLRHKYFYWVYVEYCG